MTRDITIGPCRLILGDCREIAPTLTGIDAVITDPPYGISHQKGSGALPSLSVCSGCAPSESWVVQPFCVFGLPGSHACVSAKDPIGMEVGGRSGEENVAPLALFGYAISPTRIHPSNGTCVSTDHGAILPRPVPIRQWSLARRTVSELESAISVLHVAFRGAEARWPIFPGVELLRAAITLHGLIIDCTIVNCKRFIEIDPKHYQTAVDRVQREFDQGVLSLKETPKPMVTPALL